MGRLAAVSLALGVAGLAASPARAFCVRNASSVPVEVQLRSLSALSSYTRVLQTGERACCDWLYRNCNPSAGRNARLTLSIAGHGQQHHDFYCSGPVPRRTMAVSDGEITVLDDPTRLEGLRCDSRDFYGRDVQDANQYRPALPPLRTRPTTP